MKFTIDNFLERKSPKELNDIETRVIVTTKKALKEIDFSFDESLKKWQTKDLEKSSKTVIAGSNGPVIVKVVTLETADNDYNLTKESEYSIVKESSADIISEINKYKAKKNKIETFGISNDGLSGLIVGIDLSLYRYENSLTPGKIEFKKDGKKLSETVLKKSLAISKGVNQARHLVNLPPNLLNPVSYAKEVEKLLKNDKSFKVTIFDEKKLKKEGAGLILGVGQASHTPARIVKIQYRAGSAKTKQMALVGKGITFDSGGLNMKPGGSMRLMKKDMGGSATMVGLLSYLKEMKPKKNIDIFLALAENSVSDNATRPSDILTAMNGMKVEIDNTDAEGRLAMADAITLAKKDNPSLLINVATLTGAGKIALGDDIASLLSNNDDLADKLLKAGSETGDLAWRLPLFRPYFRKLKSDFADMKNSAGTGKGGTITAALFIEKFIGDTKWAHLDIFGWTSPHKPSLVQQGGNGQGVEMLIKFLS